MDESAKLIVAVGIAFITFRYFFGSPSTGSTSSSRRPIPQSSIETVSNMFPGITPVAIRYELERTGNNVQSVVERCLRDGRLPEPPAGFFPDEVPAPTPVVVIASQSNSSQSKPPISLITKLGLERRKDLIEPTTLSSSGSESEGEGSDKGKAKAKAVVWETSSEKRESSLKERKAKMVLEARRKLLEKEQERLAKGKGKAV